MDHKEALTQAFLAPIGSPEHLRDWIYTYLGLYIPLGSVDPGSNSSPIGWLYEAYTTIRLNRGNKIPGYVVYAPREGYKTLTTAILEVLCAVHFMLPVAHMAAIESQAKKSAQYVNNFIRKVKPYLDAHGMNINKANSRNIELVDGKRGQSAYIVLIICTLQGANCVHPDSIIWMADGQKKKAKTVSPGETVQTWDYTLQKHVTVKVGSVSYTNKPAREICFSDGSNIVVSDDHQVFTQRGWIPAAKMRLGDQVTGFEGGAISKTEYKQQPRLPTSREVSSDSLDFTRCICTGQIMEGINRNGFKSTKPIHKTRTGRKWLRAIRENLTVSVTEITPIGYQDLIDLHIDTDNPHQKSFLANSGKLLHNSEHTSLFCVEQNEKVLIKNPSQKTNRVRRGVEARLIHKRLKGGQSVEVLSFNHELGRLEFKPLIRSMRSKKDLIQLTLEGGKSIKVTPEHEMFVVGKGYVPAAQICLGDSLLFLDKSSGFGKEIAPLREFDWSPPSTINMGNCKCCGRTYYRALVSQRGTYCSDTVCQAVKSKIFHPLRVTQKDTLGEAEVYDFTVADNHNFFVNNTLSHNCIDEVDVVRFPQAYEEAKMIPGVINGQFPLNIKTSTRKFAFGLMQKEIDNAKDSGDVVLHWNIIDVTERCPPTRHKPKQKKVERWIRPQELPLSNLGAEELALKSEEERDKYIKIKAFAGCKSCPLLPVCQMRLAKRPECDEGGLWKPIDFVINQFRKISPDMAEAQLMCWKPSSKGLIYPKFSTDLEDGNAYTIPQAYEVLTGYTAPADITFTGLVRCLLQSGIQMYGHVDWGFRHCYAIVITARIPNGEWWMMHTVAVPGLELDEMVKIALEQRGIFRVRRWHPDTSQPSYIKTFNKNGLACQSFKKDIDAGIEAVRKQIIDAYGRRRLKVIRTEHNDFLIAGFQHHHFKLDAAGRPTREPDDEEYADVMDALRYGAQNLFGTAGNVISPSHDPLIAGNVQQPTDWLKEKVRQLTNGECLDGRGKSQAGTIFFDFGGISFEDEDLS